MADQWRGVRKKRNGLVIKGELAGTGYGAL